MSRKKSPKKPTVLTPVYALVGATEMTANALRELGSAKDEGAGTPSTREATPVLSRLRGDVVDIARGTTRVPGLAFGEVRSRYAEFTERGQKTVSGVVPIARKARDEGDAAVRAEEAKARREARRLARQAGATVSRGRDLAGQAVGEAGRTAERTLEVVRTEANHVVDAVSHPGRIKARPMRRAAVRAAAVSDTSVTSTSPAGGEAESTKVERPVAAGVEAGASTSARRSPRARKAAEGASKPATKRATKAAQASTPTTATTTAKKSAAKSTSAAKKSASKSATPSSGAPAAPKPKTAPRSAAKKTAASPAAGDSQPHLDVPTPADVARVVESDD